MTADYLTPTANGISDHSALYLPAVLIVYILCSLTPVEHHLMITRNSSATIELSSYDNRPPENELQKVGERVPSEHELRVQRSLQRLNVPDWYKNSPAAREGGAGFRLKRHSDASQHGGWRALGSKTTSLSSLSSSSNRQPVTGTLLSPSPTPPVFSRWSTSLLNSAGSSPANSARSSFNHRQPYLGWRSQERLSNPRTPAERLAHSTLPQLQNAKQSQQQQQDQQSQNQHLQLLSPDNQNQRNPGTTASTPGATTNQEVRNSIKEVTSAIVHYVQSGQEVVGGRLSPRHWDDRSGARSTSPRGSTRLVWMESSFVGVRPMDSPDTGPASIVDVSITPIRPSSPAVRVTSPASSATPSSPLPRSPITLGPHYHQYHHQSRRQSGGCSTTTDEDDDEAAVATTNASTQQKQSQQDQDNLYLELAEDPKTAAMASNPHQPQQQQLPPRPSGRPPLQRRRSEGSDNHPPIPPTRSSSITSASRQRQPRQFHQQQQQLSPHQEPPRRVSFDGSPSSLQAQDSTDPNRIIKCRNSKCSMQAPYSEARRIFKSCHNCNCLYCSRECRRAHWPRHRKLCAYSRASSLCLQVLSSAKRDPPSLHHLSQLARRGFLEHGRGAVRCFFGSPEAAEAFVQSGLPKLGEPSFVKWSDIQPSEMGAELYAEAVRLCEAYNPETRLVLYVSVCVVREVASSTGTVMWERQPVSRCAKLKLDQSSRATLQSQCSQSSACDSLATASPSKCSNKPPDSPVFLEPIVPIGDEPSVGGTRSTLVLTSKPGSKNRKDTCEKLKRALEARGVILDRHFPQLNSKLEAYASGESEKLAPTTIYPRLRQDCTTSFVCVIMLDAEPEKLQLLPSDPDNLETIDVGDSDNGTIE
ncbi:hypothetical protein QAD02_015688 [Eretmocerus hayati]|uniref:Uncharacterized protein n=1 Tax=Eretmocerus hayati TaxID=131215 RepID=A0ACC2PAM4_9HYME|nr:hypothetical protein QAD02_015688 [Eretmocerus hayati]